LDKSGVDGFGGGNNSGRVVIDAAAVFGSCLMQSTHTGRKTDEVFSYLLMSKSVSRV